MAIDILAALHTRPAPLDFVLPGFLKGTVGSLVAPGATGKSILALEMAIGIACSVAGGDLLGLSPTTHGKVVYFATEDPEIILLHRLHAIGSHVRADAWASIAQNLVIEPVHGKRIDLMDEHLISTFIEYCSGARLIVLDTLSRIHRMDENSNSDMARLMSTLEYIADKTGASVLFLHHTNKAAVHHGQADQQQAARGASTLTDNARWSAYVAKMSSAEAQEKKVSEHQRGYFVRYGVSKQNYGEPQQTQWYRRHEGGVLLPAVFEHNSRFSPSSRNHQLHKPTGIIDDWK